MRLPVLALALLGSVRPGSAQQLSALRPTVERRIAGHGGAVALYARDLSTGDSLVLNGDRAFPASGTIRLPLLIEVFRAHDADELRLPDPLTVVDTFRSAADGALYTFDRAEDRDSTLYRRLGRTRSVEDLVELMVRGPSDLATALLLERVRPDSVQATLALLGAPTLGVQRGFGDDAARRAGRRNTATARALGRLLGALADGAAASPWSCGRMLDLLRRQRDVEGIAAGLPRRATVAGVAATRGPLHHEAGIVYVRGRPRYVLVVLTEGASDRNAATSMIADLARAIHATLEPPPPPRH
jgi:beta-lactamase class A